MLTTTYYSNRPPAASAEADPLVLAHLLRVQQAGGQHVDVPFLTNLVALLRQLGLTDNIMHLSDVRLGSVVDADGRVSRLFCLGGHDAVPADPAACPQWVEAGLNGRPTLQFARNGLVVGDFDFSQSDTYTAIALVRQVSADETGHIVACRPTNADGFSMMPNYGYMRCRHSVYYTGQDLVVNEGTNYDGGWLTIAARYNLVRPTAQLAGEAYSFRFGQARPMNYAYDNARFTRLPPAPLHLGNTDDGGLVGVWFLRDFDDEAGLSQLRELLQADYIG